MAKALIRDLAIRPGGFEFKIGGTPGEFRKALEKIKLIPHGTERVYYPETKTWFVTHKWREKLADIFSNFEKAVEAVESQGTLF